MVGETESSSEDEAPGLPSELGQGDGHATAAAGPAAAVIPAASNELAVFYNEATHRVLTRDEVPIDLGSVTRMHPGTQKEAYALYCRRHQCKVCVRKRDMPDFRRALDWFVAGRTVPVGKEHQLEHKLLWYRQHGA